MRFGAALRHLLRRQRFRQLFAVRVTSQFSDGVFQVALASYVLFSPERQPDAASIAAALAAVLLPFSVLGPFVGVFLDRWSRRQVLLVSNLVRLVPVLLVGVMIAADVDGPGLFGAILVAFSINRFFLAALSASLPHVVEPDELVLANSITPTSGTLSFMLGLGVASGLRSFLPGDDPDVAVVVIAAVGYLSAALLALRLPRPLLGPHLEEARDDVTAALRNVVTGMVAGLRHLDERRPAAYALLVIGAHRFCYGLTTVATILLYRNYFHDPDDTDAALAGLSITILVSGAGYFVAAVVTPVATTRLTPPRWIVVLLLAAAVVNIFPAGLYVEPAIVVAAVLPRDRLAGDQDLRRHVGADRGGRRLPGPGLLAVRRPVQRRLRGRRGRRRARHPGRRQVLSVAGRHRRGLRTDRVGVQPHRVGPRCRRTGQFESSGSIVISPCRNAMLAACVRLLAPSFARMLDT